MNRAEEDHDKTVVSQWAWAKQALLNVMTSMDEQYGGIEHSTNHFLTTEGEKKPHYSMKDVWLGAGKPSSEEDRH